MLTKQNLKRFSSKKAYFHHIFNILPHWKEYYKCAKYEAIKIGQNPLFTDIYA